MTGIWLAKEENYSVQLQKKYRDFGWLTAICKGVMCRTGSRLNAFSYTETIARVTDSGTLYVSSPEQAFLECLIFAPKSYSYMDLYYVMEQLTTLRSDVVQHLLETLDNNRVKRMFLYMAEKAGHFWFEELHPEKIDVGTGKIQAAANGTFNRKYNMTIPKDLEEYEG